MRDIKFRAWTGNRMIDFKEVKDMRATPWNSTSLIWMQYTGLKDKNNKEIYEGDIVKLDGSDFLKIMTFKKGSFSLDGIYGGAEAYRMKIIGNTYENPELIDNKIAA